VAILANFAENLAEHASGDGLVKYILILAPSWHVWSDLRELMNSFYNDDLAQRVLILWIMAVLVVYGNNATDVEKDIGAMRAAVGSYMVARFTSNMTHLIYSFSSYHHRAQQRLWFCLSTLALCIYIPLYIEDISLRSKVAVAAVAIVIEECIWIFSYSPAAKKILKARYTTAVDIPHEIDRFAAFYIIVLGEFLYQIIVGSPAVVGFNMRLLRAIWTLIIAFCLNWLYIHNDGALECLHPLRHSIYAAFTWVTVHLPMTASLLVAGHVSARTSVRDELEQGELWLLCGGLGVGLFCLYLVALLHRSEDQPGTLILPKVRTNPFHYVCKVTYMIPAGPPHHATYLSDNHHLSPSSARYRHNKSFINHNGSHCSHSHMENVTSLMRGAKFWEKWENTKYPEVGQNARAASHEQDVSEKNIRDIELDRNGGI
jgi:low temperature requirement protein LtrA